MKKVGKYEILDVLGKGAMGKVFRARDSRLGRLVALKTMLEGIDRDEELLQRFNIEAQAAAQLNHENIITIYDLGEEEEICYIAMEYLEGDDLKSMLNQKELTLQEKLNIILQISTGLEYAHKNGVVHRDVKPANVMILKNGKVKLMDFGIAHMASSEMTRTGMVIGTPDYMSPEQVMGKKVDNRSDIFSVGIIFYEMLIGKKPFASDSVTSILYKIAHEPLPSFEDLNVDVPIEIEAIIMKAVEKEPEKRYQSMEEMTKDLRAVIELYGEQKMATQPQLHMEIKKLIEEGKKLVRAKKYKNAAELYNKALSLDPDNSVLRRLLEKVESELLKTKKDDINGILTEAENLAKQKRFKEAIKMAESSFEILPDNTSAKVLISKIQSDAADHDKVQLLVEQEEKVKKLIEKEKFSEAVEEVMILDQIDPKNKISDKLLKEIKSLKGRAEDRKQIKMILDHIRENIKNKNFPEAEKSINAALKIDPDNVEVNDLKKKIEKQLIKEKAPAGVKPVGKPKTPKKKEAPPSAIPTVYTGSTSSQPTVVDRSDFDDTVAATKYLKKEKELKKEPQKRPNPLLVIGSIAAAVIVIVVLLFTVVLKKPAVDTTAVGMDKTTEVPASRGIVGINVIPWAEIESVVNNDNKIMDIQKSQTPCSFQLPPGSYSITLYNPELNIRKKIDIDIEGATIYSINEKMVEWNADYLMKELGIK
jgi:serine/threonine protein kinase